MGQDAGVKKVYNLSYHTACSTMGLKKVGVRARSALTPTHWYKIFIIIGTSFILTYSILTNLIFQKELLDAIVSATVLLFIVLATIFPLKKHKEDIRFYIDKAFFNTTLVLAATSVCVLILWGISVAFLPYLYMLVLFNFLLSLRYTSSRIYVFFYTFSIVLNAVGVFPLTPHTEIAIYKSASYIAYLFAHTVVTLLIGLITKYSPFIFVSLHINTSNPYIRDVIYDGLNFRLFKHRINNIVQRIISQEQLCDIEPLKNLMKTLNSSAPLKYDKFSKKLKETADFLSNLYQRNLDLRVHLETKSQDKPTIPPYTMGLIIDLLEHCLKHAQKTRKVQCSIKVSKNTLSLKLETDYYDKASVKKHSSYHDIISTLSLCRGIKIKQNITKNKRLIIQVILPLNSLKQPHVPP